MLPIHLYSGVTPDYPLSRTPIQIRAVPAQKDKPICSPSNNSPRKVPTTGWKKKNNPPLEAFSICSPRFHSRKPQAVEITPRYTRPPQIDGCIIALTSRSGKRPGKRRNEPGYPAELKRWINACISDNNTDTDRCLWQIFFILFYTNIVHLGISI